MWQNIGFILLFIGLIGVLYQCVKFVKITIPEYYGRNPGFGCLDMMVQPWFITGCIGLGLVMQSWLWGCITFGLGLFFFGFLAMLLGHLFGSKSG